MDLPEQAVEILDLVNDPGRQGQVDRVGAQEREVGSVAVVPLHPDLGGFRELAAERELRRGHVDRDHVRALARHRDRVLARAASDVEHAAALEVAAQAKVGFAGQIRPELHGVGAARLTAPGGHPIPSLGVRHGQQFGRVTRRLRTPRSCGARRRRGTGPAATS